MELHADAIEINKLCPPRPFAAGADGQLRSARQSDLHRKQALRLELLRLDWIAGGWL